jgi:hypothetical protein
MANMPASESPPQSASSSRSLPRILIKSALLFLPVTRPNASSLRSIEIGNSQKTSRPRSIQPAPCSMSLPSCSSHAASRGQYEFPKLKRYYLAEWCAGSAADADKTSRNRTWPAWLPSDVIECNPFLFRETASASFCQLQIADTG